MRDVERKTHVSGALSFEESIGTPRKNDDEFVLISGDI